MQTFWKNLTNFFERYGFIVAIIYCVLLFFMNLVHITGNTFWLDETFSIYEMTLPVKDMLHYAAYGIIDLSPPLYNLYGKVICSLFGYTGIVYQLTSFFTFIAAIILSMTLIRKKLGLDAAVVFITFYGMLRNPMYYTTEARPYALAALFVFLSFYELLLVLETDKNLHYILFTLFSLLAAYTHYFALIGVAFFYIGLLIFHFYAKKLSLKKILFTYLVTVILYAPWAIALFRGYFSVNDADINYDYGIGFWDCMNHIFQGRGQWFAAIFWIILIAEVILLFISKKKNGTATEFIFWIITGIASIVGLACTGLAAAAISGHSFFLDRYMYPVAPVAWLILAAALTRLNKRRLFFFLTMFVMWTAGLLYYVKYSKVNYDEAKLVDQTLETVSEMKADDVILIWNGAISEYGSGIYFPDNECHNATEEDLKTLEGDKTYWIIMKDDDIENINSMIESADRDMDIVMTGGCLGDLGLSVGVLR